MDKNKVVTLAEVLAFVEQAGLAETRRRDTVSAIKRICEMAGTTSASVPAQPPVLREMLAKVRPAAHGVTVKSFSNMKSLLATAVQTAGVTESLGRGRAKRDGQWGPLLEIVADDQRLSNGLATFANWCAGQNILPDEVDDAIVQRFRVWLEAKTLHPKPRDLVRAVPKMWNEASAMFNSWPTAKLAALSFKGPSKHLRWSDLVPSFRKDADNYLEHRANPDLFDERPEAPKRPLAATTLRQQREHLRLAASILTRNGEGPASLADLVKPKHFKTVLRHYHNKARGEANAFVVTLAKTLIQVAKYHAGATLKEVDELKRLAANLPAIPFDLTTKNKTLLRQLESDRPRAKLLFLPEQLMAKVAKDLERGRVRFVEAQVALAIDILLALPLRPQNLSRLNWRHNFSEPDGPRGKLLLHIAAHDTKTKRQDIDSEVPDDVARRLRWYRRQILPRLGADANGYLFVTRKGDRKGQTTLTLQITNALARHIGVHMTPHQFRHFGATSYLEQHPEGFRDRARNPWARLEQDHANLRRLVKPQSQSSIWPIFA